MKRIIMTGAILAASALFASCSDSESTASGSNTINYPTKAVVSKRDIISDIGGVKVYNGGFGSAISSIEAGVYYIMTDRGPNIDGATDQKIFSNPTFCPQIGKFKLVGDSLVLQQIIEMKDANGNKITGLPNPTGVGGSTGETALDVNGKTLDFDANGIDPEGLVAMKDGTFWVSDEYGPNIVHFAADGRTIERINPFGNGTGGRKIPAVFGKRRANRGMEGLTITPDGKYLVGMMQSPLYNPDSKVKKTALAVRMLMFEIATGACKEYVYMLNNVDAANSEIAAISATSFLVLERDGNLPGKDATTFKKIYKIDISNASNVTDAGDNGKLIGGKTIEQCTETELKSAGITPVTKEEIFDIMSISGYPHDKPEGLVIIDNNTIGIINDDDFGIGGTSTYAQKLLPLMSNAPDRNILYFVKLTKSLK